MSSLEARYESGGKKAAPAEASSETGFRRLGLTVVLAICSLIVVGVTVASLAISTLVELQNLTHRAQVHLDTWRSLADDTLYMMREEEISRNYVGLVGLAEERFAEDFAKDEEIRVQIAEVVARLAAPLARLTRFFDMALLREFKRYDIDPVLRADVKYVADVFFRGRRINPETHARLNIALRNGELLYPLHRRLSIVALMSQQSIRPLISVLVGLTFGVIGGVWLLWRKSLGPALGTVERQTSFLRENAAELEARNADLSRMSTQLLAAQRVAHIAYWYKAPHAPPQFSPGATNVLGLPENLLPTSMEECAYLSDGEERQRVSEIYANLSGQNGAAEILRSIVSLEYGNRVIRERIESWSAPDGERQMMGVMFDVTEVVRASERLGNEERIELIELVTAGVAHDFNNILGIISGQAELMAIDKTYSEKRVRGILNAVATATAITAQLRARVSQSGGELSVFSVRNAAKDCIAAVTKGSSCDSAVVLAGRDSDDFLIRANRGLFENALINVITNAREASRAEDEITVHFDRLGHSDLDAMKADTSGLDPELDYGRIMVSDTGIGMTEALRKRIVEPFFSTKSRGEGAAGRGLGLWSVFSFMQSLHGALSIATRQGEGTQVSLVFPVHGITLPETTPDATPVLTKVEDRPRALVVEDEAALRAIYASVLESFGIETIVAANATEAFSRAGSDAPFNLLVVDVDLGQGVTGLDVAEALSKRFPQLGVIVCSGLLLRTKFEEQYDNDWLFLEKPFKISQLQDAIRLSWRKFQRNPRNETSSAAAD